MAGLGSAFFSSSCNFLGGGWVVVTDLILVVGAALIVEGFSWT
jgi:hypothetical protein